MSLDRGSRETRLGVADFVAVGHVTRDVVPGAATMVGGAAYYAACTARSLGLRAAVVTSIGADFEHRRALRDVELVEVPAVASTCFHNRYEPSGRVQQLQALASPLTASDVPEPLYAARGVYICPVMGEIGPSLARAFSAELVGAGAQGWMREAGRGGRVRRRRWRPSASELDHYHLIVLSDEDAAGDTGVLAHLCERVPMVAFTHGARGSELWCSGERWWIPPFPTEQVGPTGAGDAYGAGMMAGLLWGLPPPQAGYFAACVASVVVEGPGGASLGRVAEAWGRLPRYARIHGLDVDAALALRPASPL